MAFTRDWDETDPIDHSKNSTWPAEVREVMADVAERLSSIIAGFISGEATGGIKKLPFIAQGSDPDAITDQIILYGKAVSEKTELHFKDEDGNVRQMTKGGAINPAIMGTALADWSGLMNLVYPVGSVVTLGVSTNPATLYGVGTWAQIEGKVIVGLSSGETEFDTLNETGGEKTVTLTSAQSGVPEHTHEITCRSGYAEGTSYVSSRNDAGTPNTKTTAANAAANAAEAHPNLQPYIVKYVWERTA